MPRKFWQDPVPCGECELCKAGVTEWCPDLRPKMSDDELAWKLAQWPCTDMRTRARYWAGFNVGEPYYQCATPVRHEHSGNYLGVPLVADEL